MASFTRDANLVPESNSRDWGYHIGCLPPSAAVVFTKTSLLAFLKDKGFEVSPNFGELSRLPKYATVGRFDVDPASAPLTGEQPKQSKAAAVGASTAEADVSAPSSREFSNPRPAPTPTSDSARVAPQAPPAVAAEPRAAARKEASAATVVRTAEGEAFRPTRRVREAIGGGSAQVSALFGGNGAEDDEAHREELRRAEEESARRRGRLPPAPSAAPKAAVDKENRAAEQAKAPETQEEQQQQTQASAAFRPSRRVREPGGTGGSSSIALG